MKYSVIVPVYAAEAWLEECLDSILRQTLSDFELILVDDASPDGCGAICDRYAAEDPRIRVIHKPENEGLGFARNTGIRAASGEYVLFADADDRVSHTLLACCDRALLPETDILVFGIALSYEDRNGNLLLREPRQVSAADFPDDKAAQFVRLSRDGLFPFAWNKVYRAAFLRENGLEFEKTPLIEDFLFNIAAFGAAKGIQTLSDVLYTYRKPARETLASRYTPEFFPLSKRKYALELQFLQANGCTDPGALDLVHENMVKHILSAMVRNRAPQAALSPKEQRREIQIMVNDPAVEGLLRDYRPRGIRYRVVCGLLRKKRTRLLLILAALIQFSQSKLLPLYRHLRS